MKRISLTELELQILETALIEYGSLVTFEQLSSLFNENREYTRKRVSKLARQGWLKRIKKGVYAITDFSTRGSLPISPLAVGNTLVEEAYISFENALQYHGLFDQLLTQINLVSLKHFQTTKIDGISYNFIKTQEQYSYGWETYEINGQWVKLADPEKALIDLLQFHRTRYSTDLVLEKLREYTREIDQNKLINYGLKANLTTRRILGFLMDCAGVDSDRLLESTENSSSVSVLSRTEDNIYNHKWKLYYDRHFTQYLPQQADPPAA